MTRTLLALAFLLAPGFAVAQEKKPNILFIYTDDHSYRSIGCYPESLSWAKTPHIDSLAKKGIRFTHAYLGAWCTPSRASILTGKHPHGVESLRNSGVYPSTTYDAAQVPFWPSVFRRLGYYTAQIGKWHTGTDTGFGRDWDFQIVWNRPKHTENSTHYYDDQIITFQGKKEERVKGYSTDNYTNWAVDFIKGGERDKTKPWMLWLCYGATHGPYHPAERHKKDFAGEKAPIPADIFGPRDGKPDYVQKMDLWVKGPNGEPMLKKGKKGGDFHELVRTYQRCTNAIDEGVGKLLAALAESGQLENTLIVFTSDQGFAWGQHGFMHKLAPYDSNIRSPFIVSMPSRLPQGKTCPVPVAGVDLIPTFFAFAGFELPWKMHGHDLTPLLKNPDAAWPHVCFSEFTGDKFGSDTKVVPKERYHDVPWWVSINEGRYKYIRNLEAGETEELYDQIADPEQLKNLAHVKEHRERLLSMREKTIAELRRTEAAMVDNLPAVKKLAD